MLPDSGPFQLLLRERLRRLPRRAVVAFAVRCAKRVEVMARLARLVAEGCAAGVDAAAALPPPAALDAARHAARYADDAARYADPAADAADAARYADDAARGADPDADISAADAATADAEALARLNLGARGEAGEPIRWDDPRLGPLWPDGPPAWHAELEAACRELGEKLLDAAAPAGGESDLPDYILSQLDDRRWLDGLRDAGELEGYRGEYVIAAKRAVLAHHKNLLLARKAAEKKAAKGGIPAEWLTNYFVPSH